MTNEDRDLLQRLRAEEADLREALARLSARLGGLEARADRANGASPPAAVAELPPIPAEPSPPPIPPTLPRIPAAELPPVPPTAHAHFEFRLGRWLTRLGAVFFILFLISLDAYFHLHRFIGRAGQLGILGAISIALVAGGRRLEARGLRGYGRSLTGAGLGGLYFTLYAATALPPWQLVTNPVAGGLLLLAWSAYVFDLARRRRSQPMAVLALVLAFVGTAFNVEVGFTLAADLLLAGTAVAFFLRFGWSVLPGFSLAGADLALLRRLVFDENNEFTFNTSRALAFVPHAVYLAGAWAAFTAAVVLGRSFRSRAGFLTANNALGAGLLALTAIICGYDAGRIGATLSVSGLVLLAVAAWTARRRPDLADAYLAQGLALVTGGLMLVFVGPTRCALLLVETFLLGLAGALTRSRAVTVSAAVIAFFTTGFLLWTLTIDIRHPWVLGLAGAAVMLKNAWWTRRRLGAPHFAWPATLYGALGLLLLGALLAVELEAATLPPALALIALAATLPGFALKLGELPPLAQVLLLSAQGLALFPTENGEPITGWSPGWVMIATVGMILAIRRTWLRLLDPLYALALIGLIGHGVRPEVSGTVWMVDAALFSVAFLLIGALSRVWSLAWMGQIFLALAVWHFFQRVGDTPWAAAVPLAAVFATGRALHRWLDATPAFTGLRREAFRGLARLYRLLGVMMTVDALVVLVPLPALASTFLLLGTVVLALNARKTRAFGVRLGFIFSGLGALLICRGPEHPAPTVISALAVLSFLTQSGLLVHAPKPAVKATETWLLVIAGAITAWVYLGDIAAFRWGDGAITVGWAFCALILFLTGLIFYERRQRWCGLVILFAAVLRVFIVDFWTMTGGLRVLTFIVLTLVSLGLGFLYARHADRLKTLL